MSGSRLPDLPFDVQSHILEQAFGTGLKGLARAAQVNSQHYSVNQAAVNQGINHAATNIQKMFKGRIDRDMYKFLDDQHERHGHNLPPPQSSYWPGITPENLKKLAQHVHGDDVTRAERNILNRNTFRFVGNVAPDEGSSMRYRNRLFKLPHVDRVDEFAFQRGSQINANPAHNALWHDWRDGRSSARRADLKGFTKDPQAIRNRPGQPLKMKGINRRAREKIGQLVTDF